jgi:WD40 repeat protein
VRLWDVATGKAVRRFEGHAEWVFSVAFSPDSKRALSGSYDRTVRLWDIETGQELRRFQGHADHISCAVFSPDGERARQRAGGRVRWWYFRQGSSQSLDLPAATAGGPVTLLQTNKLATFSNNGVSLSFANTSKLDLQVWDLEALQDVQVGHFDLLFSGGVRLAHLT